jgi:glucose repression regulatory protein TUP1
MSIPGGVYGNLFNYGSVMQDETTSKNSDLYIRSVCFSPDGVYLATGAEDRIIRVWDIAHSQIKMKLNGFSY